MRPRISIWGSVRPSVCHHLSKIAKKKEKKNQPARRITRPPGLVISFSLCFFLFSFLLFLFISHNFWSCMLSNTIALLFGISDVSNWLGMKPDSSTTLARHTPHTQTHTHTHARAHKRTRTNAHAHTHAHTRLFQAKVNSCTSNSQFFQLHNSLS